MQLYIKAIRLQEKPNIRLISMSLGENSSRFLCSKGTWETN